MSKWVVYDPLGTNGLPKGPGCYAVYADGELIYIGQSRSVHTRLSAYKIRFGYSNNIHSTWGSFRRLVVKVRVSDRYGDWAMHELRLIKRLQPPLNQVGSTASRVSRIRVATNG